jgi:hypothetical protein
VAAPRGVLVRIQSRALVVEDHFGDLFFFMYSASVQPVLSEVEASHTSAVNNAIEQICRQRYKYTALESQCCILAPELGHLLIRLFYLLPLAIDKNFAIKKSPG